MKMVGHGKFSYDRKKGGLYKGTVPMYMANGKEHDVYIVPKEDFDRLISGGLELLFGNKEEMSEEMFNAITDSILIPNKDDPQNPHKLYLDRHFYYNNANNMIWCRWESVDNAEKEGEFRPDPNGNIGDEYGC